jgi:hypothetical protein
MMDKAKRSEMLAKLDKGEITVPEAVERYGVTERHIRRLLAQLRKGPRPVHEKPFATEPTAPLPGASTVPETPTAQEIDAALGNGPETSADENLSPEPTDDLTADMAVEAGHALKMLYVVWLADALEVEPKHEKKILSMCKLTPLTVTVLRKQKPESFAMIQKMAESPWAVPVVLLGEAAMTGMMIYKLAPKKEEKKEGA